MTTYLAGVLTGVLAGWILGREIAPRPGEDTKRAIEAVTGIATHGTFIDEDGEVRYVQDRLKKDPERLDRLNDHCLRGTM